MHCVHVLSENRCLTSLWLDLGTWSYSSFSACLIRPDFPPTQSFNLFCIVISFKHGASAFFPHKLIIMEEMCSLSESISGLLNCLLSLRTLFVHLYVEWGDEVHVACILDNRRKIVP